MSFCLEELIFFLGSRLYESFFVHFVIRLEEALFWTSGSSEIKSSRQKYLLPIPGIVGHRSSSISYTYLQSDAGSMSRILYIISLLDNGTVLSPMTSNSLRYDFLYRLFFNTCSGPLFLPLSIQTFFSLLI